MLILHLSPIKGTASIKSVNLTPVQFEFCEWWPFNCDKELIDGNENSLGATDPLNYFQESDGDF